MLSSERCLPPPTPLLSLHSAPTPIDINKHGCSTSFSMQEFPAKIIYLLNYALSRQNQDLDALEAEVDGLGNDEDTTNNNEPMASEPLPPIADAAAAAEGATDGDAAGAADPAEAAEVTGESQPQDDEEAPDAAEVQPGKENKMPASKVGCLLRRCGSEGLRLQD